jgi:hypothetical protein
MHFVPILMPAVPIPLRIPTTALAWQVVMPQAAVAEVQVLATGIAVANPRDISQVFAFRT